MSHHVDPLEIRVMEALLAEFDELELPAHFTAAFVRPRLVLPEDCPLLCVYPMQKAYIAENVVEFTSAAAYGVSWQEEQVDRLETLIDDPERAKGMIRAVATIEGCILRLSQTGLTVKEVETPDGRREDAVYAVLPIGWDLSEPAGVEEGAVSGYAFTLEVDAVQTKAT
jgi:hypothetical protein